MTVGCGRLVPLGMTVGCGKLVPLGMTVGCGKLVPLSMTNPVSCPISGGSRLHLLGMTDLRRVSFDDEHL
jgi:hypothetical protein